jgi:ATP-dependent 26S proteasome regulatory subunit
LLVLEDLDSLVGGDTMSFFLNEMDGFRANDGLLTVATTNYLDRIDPALTQRPSRFDRKIPVESPSAASRRQFLDHNLGLADPELVALTDGFSIAFLAELSLSVRMDQLRNGKVGPASGDRVREIVTDLRQQIRQTEAPAEAGEDDDDG